MRNQAEPELRTQIYDLLYSLGADAGYVGFFHTSYAVNLAIQQPERLLLVTKWLYPDVARHYHTSWYAVERNIRTLARVAWMRCPGTLSRIAGYDLDRVPSNTRFISMLAAYLQPPNDIASSYPFPLNS